MINVFNRPSPSAIISERSENFETRLRKRKVRAANVMQLHRQYLE